MSAEYDQLLPTLKSSLPARGLCRDGRAVGFIQRLRDLRAGPFVWALVLSRFARGRPGFSEARSFYARLTGRTFRPRPFQMRVKSPGAVRLLEQAFERMTHPWRSADRSRPKHPLAKQFADIVVIDSTLLHVHDSLRTVFKGLRTAVASMKVTLTLSVFGNLPLHAHLGSGTAHDTRLLPPLSMFPATALLLFDKGFVSYSKLGEIDEQQLFFLCPMKRNGNARILAAHYAPVRARRELASGAKPMLRNLLPRTKKIRRHWDLHVALRTHDSYHCAKPVTARLVIVPGPRGEQRAYLTNLPPAWTPIAIRELYRLRWQIELVFKELKQHLNLESLPSRDPNAVRAFVWASLLALALSRLVSICLLPRHQLGMRASHRLALVTRALGDALHLLVLVLQLPVVLPAFAHEIRRAASVSKYERRRTDSYLRLETLTPKAA